MDALKRLFGISVVLKILDIGTTFYLVYNYGIHAESNPFVYDMMLAYGYLVGLLINAGIYSLLVYVLYIYKQHNLLLVAIALMTLVVLSNIASIFSH